jgi:mannosyltransferase
VLLFVPKAAPHLFSQRPHYISANFQNELQLLGYHLQDKRWYPGETLTLHVQWLVRKPLQNYKIFLHLVTQDDSRRVAQADSEPMLSYSSMTRWEPGEIVADQYRFILDNDIPAGRYLLLMGVYHPETVQNLSMQPASNVLPGDRLVLAEVEIGDR